MADGAIQPTIDAYGTYARASNLADHLELLALHGDEVSRIELADLITDQGMTAKMDEHFTGPPPPSRDDFDAGDEQREGAVGGEPGLLQADRVFDVLAERNDILDDLYPFEIDETVKVKDGADFAELPYIALLALTLAHAHEVEVKPDTDEKAVDPKQVLEALVARTLMSLSLAVSNVGEVSRATSDFRKTVVTCGTAVGLQPTPKAAVSLKDANEEGVDTLAHFAVSDHRAGNWVFLGQVTCGKSDTWTRKLAEPKAPGWKLYLSVLVEPQGFLAVPHHVESHHLTKLVQDGDRMVLDRLRLSRFCRGVSDAEKAIINAVLSVGAERRT